MVKDNHSELKQLLDEWVTVQRSGSGLSRPDVVEINKGHGRIERRELWAVPSGELGPYLEQEYGWPAMAWCGRIRRERRPSRRTEKSARGLRGHWTSENGVFRVWDVSYHEDRLHGRKGGIVLSKVRHAAINQIRSLGYPYIPDGWRGISARTDYGLAFVTALPLLEK